jgi:hypothetical protein
MTGAVTNWFKENQVLIIGLIGQAIVAGIYMVNLEARVSILEVRGSPHLQIIDNRLTVHLRTHSTHTSRGYRHGCTGCGVGISRHEDHHALHRSAAAQGMRL